MNMIERVARALADDLFRQIHENKASLYASDMDGTKIIIDGEVDLYEAVKAALVAMRDPTDLMGNGLPPDYKPGSHSATAVWQAMIDAALEETK
ncbi:hypothetical protein N8A98_06920 [Devosia neptuniae]|uniref:Uncharacterized protein n=1 Tax=Devosia neptuniae TaxID=191302 RepID=A0ABY6CGG9_9HYPH|nr:hypothetical protein [Devosia neptuniae]UXN70913.1 hypothetical protein N8A98_06920 [Devosia neptuniae]